VTEDFRVVRLASRPEPQNVCYEAGTPPFTLTTNRRAEIAGKAQRTLKKYLR
jgi:hypothetical protein